MFKTRFGIVCWLIVTAFSIGTAYGQTIRVADNNLNAPAGANVFASLQDAVDAAVDGDIIQVTPSPDDYGNVTINRRLTVYGIGLDPDRDMPYRSEVGRITFGHNVLFQTDSTVVTGLVVAGVTFSGGSGVTLSDIVIEGCRITSTIGVNSGSVDNLRIRDCLISAGSRPSINFLGDASNLLITNNILYNLSTYLGGGAISADNHAVISNNIFIASTNSSRSAFLTARDCIVANNIFYGVRPGSGSGSERNEYHNNLTFGTSVDDLPPAGTGNTGADNLVGVNPLLENFPLDGSNTFDFAYDFRLQAGSPAIGAGSDGTDIGIFGGSSPFDTLPRVLPSLPFIEEFNASNVVRQGGNLNVTVKAKSN